MGRRKDLPTVIDATKVVPSQKFYPNGIVADLQPGDNSKALAVIMQFNNLPVVDLNDPKQVKDLIETFNATLGLKSAYERNVARIKSNKK